LVDGLPSGGIAWAWLVDLGAVHTGLAYVLLYAGIRRIETAQAALLQFVAPVSAVLVDWWAYQQSLHMLQGVGLGLTLLALMTSIRIRGGGSQKGDSLSSPLPLQGVPS